MSGHTREWDRFNEKSPIRKESLTSNMEVLNAHLINDIEDAGQGALSAAKCFRLTGRCTNSMSRFDY